MKLILTKKEVFRLKLCGDPIVLRIPKVGGWTWPEMINFLLEVDVLKKLPNNKIEVLHEIHLEPRDKELTKTFVLRIGKTFLHRPLAVDFDEHSN